MDVVRFEASLTAEQLYYLIRVTFHRGWERGKMMRTWSEREKALFAEYMREWHPNMEYLLTVRHCNGPV